MSSSPQTFLTIPVEKNGVLERIPIPEFEKITGALFIPQIDLHDFKTLQKIIRKTEKYSRKGELTREQLWLGAYFRTEILTAPFPDVFFRYIDPIFGWGVFAARNFRKMEFLAEYSGKLRRRRRSDRKNAYCFEYVLASGLSTPYIIDALEQGGVSRYINHSASPNLQSALATVDKIGHIILIAKEEIPKGAQLCYDYGESYWACRPKPH